MRDRPESSSEAVMIRKLEDAQASDDFFSHDREQGTDDDDEFESWWTPLHSYINSPYEGVDHLDRALVGRQGHSMTTHRLQDDAGTWREFIIVTGGISERGMERIFPVWAYETTEYVDKDDMPVVEFELLNRWIDLSGKLYGNRDHPDFISQHNRLKPPPPGTWPEARIGHLSHVTTNGVLHVWGGTKFHPPKEKFGHAPKRKRDLELQCEEVPYVWRSVLPRDVLLRNLRQNLTTTDGMLLRWERIIPHVMLGNSPSSPTSNKCVAVGDSNSTVEQDLPQFWNLNQAQWNVTGSKASLRQSILAMQRLRRSHAKGGPWRHSCGMDDSSAGGCHSQPAASESFVMYGGLYRLSVDTHSAREDPSLTDPYPTPQVVDSYQVLGDVWSYHFDSCTFNLLSTKEMKGRATPPPRTRHAATVFNNNQLIVHGGWTSQEATLGSERRALADMWRFDLKGKQWTELRTAFQEFRLEHSMVSLNLAWGSDGGIQPGSAPSQDDVVAVQGGCREEILSKIPCGLETCVAVTPFMYLTPMTTALEVDVWFVDGLDPSPPPRSGHSTVLDSSGRMYLWGGNPQFRNDKFDTIVWRLSPPSNYKDTISQMHMHEGSAEAGTETFDLDSWLLQFLFPATVVGILVLIFRFVCRGQTEHQTSTGLSTMEIQSLQLRHYQETPSSENAASNDNFGNGEGCCPICLVDYVNGDSLRCLPCKHEFHQACADSWFVNHKTCPFCRHSVLLDEQNIDASSAPESSSPEENFSNSRGVLSRGALQRRLQLGRLRVTNVDPSSTLRALTEEATQLSSNVVETVDTTNSRSTGRPQSVTRPAVGRQGRSMMARLRTSLRYPGRPQQEWDIARFSSDLSLHASVNDRHVGEDDNAGDGGDGMEMYENVTEMVNLA